MADTISDKDKALDKAITLLKEDSLKRVGGLSEKKMLKDKTDIVEYIAKIIKTV